MSVLSLLINDERFYGWTSIRVTRGLERAAADFALGVSHVEPWPIYPGAECKVYIDNDLVITGWVDIFRPSVSATEHRIECTGRSKTCDFVDSSVTLEGGQLTGLTVRQVAETLAQPFGFKVIAEEEGEAVPEVQVQQSETCFKLVERLARLQELLVTDDAEGNLVLTRAGNKTTDSSLIYGVNIEEASADLDHAHRFSDYIVKAQRPGNRTADSKTAEGRDPWKGVIVPPGGYDPPPGGRAVTTDRDQRSTSHADLWRAAWRERMLALRTPPLVRAGRLDGGDATDDWDWDGTSGSGSDTHTDRGMEAISQIVGTAHDDAITRYRPLVIIAETQADGLGAEKRADWELRRRLAKSTKANVAVNGWHQQNGELWRPNLMVYTEVPYFGLERELIVSQVTFEMGDQGEMTRLELTLPDAFLPEKIRKPKRQRAGRAGGARRGRKGKGMGDSWIDHTIGPGKGPA